MLKVDVEGAPWALEPLRAYSARLISSVNGAEMGARKTFDSQFAFGNVSTRFLGRSVNKALLVRIFEFDQMRAFSLSEP